MVLEAMYIDRLPVEKGEVKPKEVIQLGKGQLLLKDPDAGEN